MQRKQTVFISGISRGIGKEVAAFLVKKGFNVWGSCRKPRQLKDKITDVQYVALDLADASSIKECAATVGDIDVLINNAGQSQMGAFEDTPVEKVRELFEINYFGMLQLIQLFLPSIKQSRFGKIINIGSMNGTFPLPFFTGYGATKSATQMLSYCLRHELRKFGVQVAVVEPNDIKTTISPEVICNEKGNYYREVNIVRKAVRSKMNKAHDPVCVAKLIYKLLQKNKLSGRYVVGGAGPVLSFCKRFSPDSLVEYTVSRMYKLN